MTNSVSIAGNMSLCLIADGADFRSRRVASLTLEFAGIVGDNHAGVTRLSGSREPWYPRGTVIRNDRQITVVSVEELTAVAAAMDLPAISPEWIGANLVLSGLPDLSRLPRGTKVFFPDGACLNVEAENMPCRVAGRAVAEHYPRRDGLDLLFPKLARHRRGLVASVERPGTIRAGETVIARVPEQFVYQGGR
jgi:hypothetical protein